MMKPVQPPSNESILQPAMQQIALYYQIPVDTIIMSGHLNLNFYQDGIAALIIPVDDIEGMESER